MTTLIALCAALVQRQFVSESPFKQSSPLAIESAALSADSVLCNDLLEIKVVLKATYVNPFDPAQIDLHANISGPAGKYVVPGFLYRPFERALAGQDETLKAGGDVEWRVRFSPREVGDYAVVLSAKDKTGKVEFKPLAFSAKPPTRKGFVRVSEKDQRFFAFQDGSSFWPVGANVCWADPRGTFAYDEWLPKYAENGANYARLWLSPSWTTFALEQPGKQSEGKGMGQFDLANAWRLDHVVSLARSLDIQLMLCIDSYNILRAGDAYPWWEKTPHNSDNGGPLRIPTDFWSDERMQKLYRDKLRYLVARYGAFSNMFAWEFWNEVDLTSDFDVERVRDWHKAMATSLREMDPYKHLVTTSTSSAMGYKELDLLPELDYFQTHHYGDDPALTTIVQQSRKGGQGKPHYVGEIGADAGGARKEDDPKGIQVHDPMWAAIASGSSGTAMSWWWDSLIAPNNLYSLYRPVSDFVKDVNWQDEGFKQTTPSFAYEVKPKAAPRKDLVFSGGPVEWRASALNQPTRVSFIGGKLGDASVLAGIQHGFGNHPELHNPATFDVQVSNPTKFVVEVGDVSGYGGAVLNVWIDDQLVLEKNFRDPDGDEKTDSLRQYAGRYQVTIPAGRHTVKVENMGKDWFMVSYRFVDLLPRTNPPVQGWAVVGDTKVMAWLRREGRSWREATRQGSVGTVPASVMGLNGLASGKWKAEVWDTWTGKVLRSKEIAVPVSGKVRLNVPGFSQDVAVKLSRQWSRTGSTFW